MKKRQESNFQQIEAVDFFVAILHIKHDGTSE